LIEPRGRWFVEEPVIAAGAHSLCGCSPTAARVAHGSDHQPAWFGVEFNFFRKVRFIEQRLWDADPSRIADPDDARSCGHCDYSVSTLEGRGKEGVPRNVPRLDRRSEWAAVIDASAVELLLVILTGWLARHERDVLRCRVEENLSGGGSYRADVC